MKCKLYKLNKLQNCFKSAYAEGRGLLLLSETSGSRIFCSQVLELISNFIKIILIFGHQGSDYNATARIIDISQMNVKRFSYHDAACG